MPALDPLVIWNLALSAIKASEVASMGEQSLEARECRRHYPHALGMMLEGPQDYGFSKKRSTLALMAVNDRPGEWGYAYAAPSDLASPIRLLPTYPGLGHGIPVPIPGEPYLERWGAGWQAPAYAYDGDTIYANATGAALEYVRSNVDGLTIPQMVIDALAKDLAARLAVPVKGERDLKRELMAEAEVAWQRAIADDRNRQPESYDYMPESIAARHNGYC